MSTTVKQFHEEEAIGKTYDFQIARRLLRYLKPYVRLLIPALALTLSLNLLGILQPKFTEYAIDWFIIPRKTDGITLFAFIYVAVQLARFVFSYFQSVLLNSVGQYVMFDLRREIYNKLQHQEVAYYDRNPVGRIMTRLTADVDALNELFTSGVTDLIGDLVMIAAIMAVMFYMDWRLTLVSLLTVPMLVAATTWFRKARAAAMTWCARALRASSLFYRNTSPARKRSSFLMPSRIRCAALPKSMTNIGKPTSTRFTTMQFSSHWLISLARPASL